MATYMKKLIIHPFTKKKKESVQYNACVAITGAIRGTLKEKLYDELALECPFDSAAGSEKYATFTILQN